MKNVVETLFLVSLLLLLSCSKDETKNSLGGDTDIALTKVDSVSDLYITIDNDARVYADMKVLSNKNGDVTYGITVDLKTLTPDVVNILLNNFSSIKDKIENRGKINISNDMILDAEFTIKITSEGYLDYFVDGKPWIVAKYSDGVGTKYTVVSNSGETLTRTVTEKTGENDWPLGFFDIKTSLIEQEVPAGDPLFKKISYRVNHKFGLVYLEVVLQDGHEIKTDIIPWFLL